MNLFVLVAMLCSPEGNQCDHYALDSNLSLAQCDSYFTDSGVMEVDKLVNIVQDDLGNKTLVLASLECIEEDTE